MTPVFQRIVCRGRGDCTTACLASILNLHYEDVPAFVAEAVDMGQPHRWHKAYLVWLREIGYHIVDVMWDDLHDWRGLDGTFAILSVPSQRFEGIFHDVVCTWDAHESGAMKMRIVHDPNPGNQPYPDTVAPSFVRFLVPRVPEVSRHIDLVHALKKAREVINAPVVV